MSGPSERRPLRTTFRAWWWSRKSRWWRTLPTRRGRSVATSRGRRRRRPATRSSSRKRPGVPCCASSICSSATRAQKSETAPSTRSSPSSSAREPTSPPTGPHLENRETSVALLLLQRCGFFSLFCEQRDALSPRESRFSFFHASLFSPLLEFSSPKVAAVLAGDSLAAPGRAPPPPRAGPRPRQRVHSFERVVRDE